MSLTPLWSPGEAPTEMFNAWGSACERMAHLVEGLGPSGIAAADLESGSDSDNALANLCWAGFYEECLLRIDRLPPERLISSTTVELLRMSTYGRDALLGRVLDHDLTSRLKTKLPGPAYNHPIMLSPGGPIVDQAELPRYFGETSYEGPLRLIRPPDSDNLPAFFEATNSALQEETLPRAIDGLLRCAWAAYYGCQYPLSAYAARVCLNALPLSVSVAGIRFKAGIGMGEGPKAVDAAKKFHDTCGSRLTSAALLRMIEVGAGGRKGWFNLYIMRAGVARCQRKYMSIPLRVAKRIPRRVE